MYLGMLEQTRSVTSARCNPKVVVTVRYATYHNYMGPLRELKLKIKNINPQGGINSHYV